LFLSAEICLKYLAGLNEWIRLYSSNKTYALVIQNSKGLTIANVYCIAYQLHWQLQQIANWNCVSCPTQYA